jgi:hypothetical protein
MLDVRGEKEADGSWMRTTSISRSRISWDRFWAAALECRRLI